MENVVTATLKDADLQVVTIADQGGSWWLHLPPQPAGTGHTIHISDGTTDVILEDVAFGDVCLYGMFWTVQHADVVLGVRHSTLRHDDTHDSAGRFYFWKRV
jgi:hypothetical protein